ncbi:META domain-containing protein [uncultured Roseovarius sp.]|uniref:META domain-containing protein n=1 Tax=uncultured Roseovarius sp. TaxID=293344 RepID=UPI002619826C|nr:META domain-containing protein [uncultured Roseovarius sp.]
MRTVLLLIGMSILGHCKDETVSGHGGATATWTLQSIDGTPFTARATLSFPKEGTLVGEAPCNRYSGAQTLPYPWFRAEALVATKRACPDLEAETRYLRALAEMTLVEVAGDTLLLTNDAGREMVFRAGE